MDLIHVDSSNIDQIGYDEYEGEVHVVFKSGRHYVYTGATLEVWESFRDAPSKGGFINDEFKAKGYQYREM